MRSGRIVIGVALVLVGVLYLASAFGDVDAGGLVGRWWPLAIVGLGVAQYGIDHSAKLGSAVLIILGLILLGFTAEVIEGSVWSYLWPVAIILAGIGIMLPRLDRTPETEGDTAHGFVAVGSRTLQSRSQAFAGGELTAVLGNIVLDLSEAKLAPGAKISVTAILGGCEILVPQGWDVRIGGVPVLGGWDDTTRRDGGSVAAPVLTIRAVAILAGVEVRHPSRWA